MVSDLQKPINSGFNSKTEALDVVKDIDLSKKIAIVTGGYSGIGRHNKTCCKRCNSNYTC